MGVMRWMVIAGSLTTASMAFAQSLGPKRINFDERLIKGQTAKAGSVYIYERKQLRIESMIQTRRRWVPKTIHAIFEDVAP